MNHPCDIYQDLRTLYDAANTTLFHGTLPPCMIGLRYKAKAQGWFSQACWGRRTLGPADDPTIAMIVLNPAVFNAQTDAQILSTLVHEMVHLWQAVYTTQAKDLRPGYHDREWARKMVEVGLMPSSTGRPGGKQTGMRMNDYVLETGPFQAWYRDLTTTIDPDTSIIVWQETRRLVSRPPSVKKVKYVCPGPDCEVKAWAVEGTQLICGDCQEEMESATIQIPLFAENGTLPVPHMNGAQP
jgi:hypothetical protein